MGRSICLRGLGALALLAVLLAACGTPSGDGQLDYAVHYDNVGELVASADAVVVGRVEGELRLEQGDRGVLFLAREPDEPAGRCSSPRACTWSTVRS